MVCIPLKITVIFFGFSVNKPAVCNIVIKQLPTSILKDFSGNKHDAYLYGFKGKLNSGVGIYAQDFKNWGYGSTINKDISTKSYNKFHIVKKKADNWFGFTIGIPKNNYYNQSYKLKFNINKKIDDINFSIVSTDGNLITTTDFTSMNPMLYKQVINCLQVLLEKMITLTLPLTFINYYYLIEFLLIKNVNGLKKT